VFLDSLFVTNMSHLCVKYDVCNTCKMKIEKEEIIVLLGIIIACLIWYICSKSTDIPNYDEYRVRYDYSIELDQDSIHIDTKDGRCLYYHADSISLDDFIIQDNL